MFSVPSELKTSERPFSHMCMDHLQLPGASKRRRVGHFPGSLHMGTAEKGCWEFSQALQARLAQLILPSFLPWPCPSKTIPISSPQQNRWRWILLTSTFLLSQVQAQPVACSGVSDLVLTIVLVLVVTTNQQKTQ